jgi:hypothetical chaperone protein
MTRIGLDFGTTNSSAALFDGERVHLLNLDPRARDPTVVRSVLYLTREGATRVGQQALDAYYDQNTGRPSRMVRRYVGEVQMTFGEVGTMKGYPVRASSYFQEVYILVDELTPGRLVHSLKSGLASGNSVTHVFDRKYDLVGLIAQYLGVLRRRAEERLGVPIERVVLGRPVSFAGARTTAENDACEALLRQAAERAGFSDVVFELEAVAAALDYELRIDRPQTVFVFDLGGGTLDVTVMQVGGAGHRRVLAMGGIGLGGESFDRRIIGRLLLEHFGRGSTWGDPPMPVPSHYTDALVDWKTVPALAQPETLRFLHEAQMTGDRPARIRALESLLVNNYTVRMIEAVEGAKVALSKARFSVMRLGGEQIGIWQPITRSQYESMIGDALQRIQTCVAETMARAGLDATGIDAVVQTGGAAQTPCLESMLASTFGASKIVRTDAFRGIAAGLAVRAAQSDGRPAAPLPHDAELSA